MCRVWWETQPAGGGGLRQVESELVLVTPEYERCYCIGDPNDPAAAGSPYSKYCLHDKMNWNCFTHEMGFAEMVVPSVKFLLKIFGL